MDDVSRLGSTVPLIARTAEFEQLLGGLEASSEGKAVAVLLAGEAGVGKSRMLQEITDKAVAAGGVVLIGRCLDVGESGMPYLPFAEAVAQLAGDDLAAVQARPALGPLVPGLDLPEASRRYPVPLPPGPRHGTVEQDIGQLQLFDAVLGLLSELAERRTVLLAIEDVHWAEPSTLHLLSFLISRLRNQKLLIVATYRTDELHRRHPLRPVLAELLRRQVVQRVDLPPLSTSDSQALVRVLAAGGERPLPESMIAEIADRCEGNAFFAEELVASANDSGERLPWTLMEVLLARVERLSPAAQNVLRIAAVSVRWITDAKLRTVACDSAPAELDEALREAIGHHILVVDPERGRYTFRHALLREAVYGDLLPGERARLHARFAAALVGVEGKGIAASLAHHSLESHDLPTALAASVRAADEAERLGAPSDALRHTESALRIWDAVAEADRPENKSENRLLRLASSLCAATGQPERALSYARSAVRVAEAAPDADPLDRARSLRLLSQALEAAETPIDEVIVPIERAWELVKDLPPHREKAWVLATMASTYRDSDMAAARRSATMALAEAKAVESGSATANALMTMALVEERAGASETAQQLLQRAVTMAVEADALNTELRARFYLGFHCLEAVELDGAVATFTETLARAHESGMQWSIYGLEARILLAVATYMTGDWDTSFAATSVAGNVVSEAFVARLDATATHVLVGRGQFEQAQELLSTANDLWHVDEQIAVFSATCTAQLHVWRGAPRRALGDIERLLAYFADHGHEFYSAGIRAAAIGVTAAANLVRAGETDALATGDRLAQHAERVVEHGTPRTGSLGKEGLAWLAVTRAEHQRLHGKPAVDHWQTAVDAFDYGEIYPQAICRWRLADALLAEDRRDEAATHLRAAFATARRLGARPLREAVESLGRRGRLPLGESRTQPSATASPFTAREQAVLALVASGKTNREVGTELFISEKTVSVHLSRVMNKLGAARRAEAVAIAYDRGLL